VKNKNFSSNSQTQPTENISHMVFRNKTNQLPLNYRENSAKMETYERNAFVNTLRKMMNDYSDDIIRLTAGEECVQHKDHIFPGFFCEHKPEKQNTIKKQIEGLLDPIITNLEKQHSNQVLHNNTNNGFGDEFGDEFVGFGNNNNKFEGFGN
jgi:hypothetical protein